MLLKGKQNGYKLDRTTQAEKTSKKNIQQFNNTEAHKLLKHER